jgi:hypothetical protein
MRELIIVGAVAEALIAVIALFGGGGPAGGGLMAMVAALIGSAVAMSAQIVAVAVLRPAMLAKGAEFTKAWVTGIATRFASFVVVAVLIVTLREVLPPAWVAAGYLGMLLVLLFAETRFLK